MKQSRLIPISPLDTSLACREEPQLKNRNEGILELVEKYFESATEFTTAEANRWRSLMEILQDRLLPINN